MKPKSISKILYLLLISLSLTFTLSCNKDKDELDITGAVTLNMLNEQNGKTILGNTDIFINKANNFYSSNNLISDVGNASGIGAKKEFNFGNLTSETAVLAGHIYHIFDERTIREFPSGNVAVMIGTGYYQIYVESLIANNSISSGAIVKYLLLYPDTKGLPEREQVVGRITRVGKSVEIALPKDSEYYFEQHSGSGNAGAFEITTDNNKLNITLKKNIDNINGPYGDYRVYIRKGNVFTYVIVKVM